MKYSKIYDIRGKKMRYNYDEGLIEWVSVLSDEDKAENLDWQERHGSPLWDTTEDGYLLVDSMGCYIEDWQEDPKGMCEMWSADLDGEMDWAMDILKYEVASVLDLEDGSADWQTLMSI